MSTWLTRVLSEQPGYEAELVARYSQRLLAFAGRQLPVGIRRRVDPEDVVQSVYRSFFRRLNDGLFAFQDSHDLWRLLAAMTFHKARNAVKFHRRERRDIRREQQLSPEKEGEQRAGHDPGASDLDLLLGCLQQLLGALPESRRQIVLRRLEGESVEQIAQRVGCSRQTVYRVLAHVQDVAAQQLEASA